MASTSRKARGMRTQKVVAEFFQRHGWPWAESTGAGRSGSDITGMPGLACEIKARSDLQPQAWLRQAEANPGLPFVVFRPNGMGEQSVGRWGVLVRLETFAELLNQAGYGTQQGSDERTKDEEQEQHNDRALDPQPRLRAHPAVATVTDHEPRVREAQD